MQVCPLKSWTKQWLVTRYEIDEPCCPKLIECIEDCGFDSDWTHCPFCGEKIELLEPIEREVG